MTCDHSATRASLATFFATTRIIGGQDLGDGQWALLGVCVACNSTLAIQIAEPRGCAVHGAIVSDDPPPPRCTDAICAAEHDSVGRHVETIEQHAERVIR